jgi:hypothetical protein
VRALSLGRTCPHNAGVGSSSLPPATLEVGSRDGEQNPRFLNDALTDSVYSQSPGVINLGATVS